jgi:hypothetical protein
MAWRPVLQAIAVRRVVALYFDVMGQVSASICELMTATGPQQ